MWSGSHLEADAVAEDRHARVLSREQVIFTNAEFADQEGKLPLPVSVNLVFATTCLEHVATFRTWRLRLAFSAGFVADVWYFTSFLSVTTLILSCFWKSAGTRHR